MMKILASLLLLPVLAPGGTLSNRRAPSFALPDSKLVYHDILDYRGKVLILEFMQTTCPHCVKFSATLEKVKAKYGDKVAIVSISTPPDTTSMMEQYAVKNKVTATMLFDYGLTTAAYLKVTPKNPTVNFPHVFVIDGTGMIRDDYAYSEATLPIFEGTGLFAVIDKLLAGK